MKFLLPTLTALLVIASQVESRWVPRPGTTWNYLLDVEDSKM